MVSMVPLSASLHGNKSLQRSARSDSLRKLIAHIKPSEDHGAKPLLGQEQNQRFQPELAISAEAFKTPSVFFLVFYENVMRKFSGIQERFLTATLAIGSHQTDVWFGYCIGSLMIPLMARNRLTIPS